MRLPFSVIVVTSVCVVSYAFAADLVPQDGAQADSPVLRREVADPPEATRRNAVEWTAPSAAQASQAEDRVYLISFAMHGEGKPIWRASGTIVINSTPNTLGVWHYQSGGKSVRVNLSNSTTSDTVWLEFTADHLAPATTPGQPPEIKDFVRYQQRLRIPVNRTMSLESGQAGTSFSTYLSNAPTPDEVAEGNNRLLVTRVQ